MSANTTAPVVPGLTAVTGWLARLISSIDKEAALVLGVLTSMGVTPVKASEDKFASAILIGYAALKHIAEALAAKKAA